MTGSLIKALLIVAAAVGAAVIHARQANVSWRTDVAKAERRLAIKEAVNDGRAAKASPAPAQPGKNGKPGKIDAGAEPVSSLGFEVASLDDLRAALDGPYIIIDARPHSEFEQGHLARTFPPPVLNLDAERVFDDPRAAELMSAGMDFILYCTSLECDLAEQLYVAMTQMGFDGSRIRIFPPGWEGIEAAKLPTTAGPDEWTGFGVDDAAGEPNQ